MTKNRRDSDRRTEGQSDSKFDRQNNIKEK